MLLHCVTLVHHSMCKCNLRLVHKDPLLHYVFGIWGWYFMYHLSNSKNKDTLVMFCSCDLQIICIWWSSNKPTHRLWPLYAVASLFWRKEWHERMNELAAHFYSHCSHQGPFLPFTIYWINTKNCPEVGISHKANNPNKPHNFSLPAFTFPLKDRTNVHRQESSSVTTILVVSIKNPLKRGHRKWHQQAGLWSDFFKH